MSFAKSERELYAQSWLTDRLAQEPERRANPDGLLLPRGSDRLRARDPR